MSVNKILEEYFQMQPADRVKLKMIHALGLVKFLMDRAYKEGLEQGRNEYRGFEKTGENK